MTGSIQKTSSQSSFKAIRKRKGKKRKAAYREEKTCEVVKKVKINGGTSVNKKSYSAITQMWGSYRYTDLFLHYFTPSFSPIRPITNKARQTVFGENYYQKALRMIKALDRYNFFSTILENISISYKERVVMAWRKLKAMMPAVPEFTLDNIDIVLGDPNFLYKAFVQAKSIFVFVDILENSREFYKKLNIVKSIRDEILASKEFQEKEDEILKKYPIEKTTLEIFRGVIFEYFNRCLYPSLELYFKSDREIRKKIEYNRLLDFRMIHDKALTEYYKLLCYRAIMVYIEKGVEFNYWVQNHSKLGQQKEIFIQQSLKGVFIGEFNLFYNLEKLTINRCEFQFFPIKVSLPKLKTFEAVNCNLKELPIDFSKFSLLESLDLSNNELNMLPNGIRYLSKLKNLNISGNRFNCIPEEILHLQNLETLEIVKNQGLLDSRFFYLFEDLQIDLEKYKTIDVYYGVTKYVLDLEAIEKINKEIKQTDIENICLHPSELLPDFFYPRYKESFDLQLFNIFKAILALPNIKKIHLCISNVKQEILLINQEWLKSHDHLLL